MKIIFLILIFCHQFSLAQTSYVALITDPQIGSEDNSARLIEIIEDINKRQNIGLVVILGNLTASGEFDEFLWAQELLDGLTAPYFAIGGDKDYWIGDRMGSDIELLWGVENNFFSFDNFNVLCLNTILPEYKNRKHLSADTKEWLKEKISSSGASNILTFSFYPVNSIDNSWEFFETVLGYKLFSIVTKEDKSNKSPQIIEGLYQNRKDGWGYFLISSKGDSLFIQKILGNEIKKKSKPEVVKAKFVTPVLFEAPEQKSFSLPDSKLWTIKLKQTITLNPVSGSDKIFINTKIGNLIRLTKSGSEDWRQELNERILDLRIADANQLLAGTDDDDILFINSNNGSAFQVIGIGERITSGISLTGNNDNEFGANGIVAGTEYGNLYCYDLLSLEPLWEKQLTSGHVISPIVYSQDKIFFRNNEGTLYCRNASNGLLIWQLQVGIRGTQPGTGLSWNDIIVNGQDIYLTDQNGNLNCVDALLGTKKWELAKLNSNGLLRLSKQGIILPTVNNKIVMVSPVTGKVLNEFILPPELKNESITDLLIIDDKIITGFTNGWVYRTNLKGNTEKIFRGGSAPVISLLNVDGNCLAADYDGNLTLLNIAGD